MFKWKFWKNRKGKKADTPPPGHPNCRCFVIGLDMGKPGAENLARMLIRQEEDEAKILKDLGHKVAIAYDPDCRELFRWAIRFEVSFSFRGASFGQEGPDLVRECGLVFPNARTPWVDGESQGIRQDDDDCFIWVAQERPTARQIAAVVQETQRQVEELMRAYWFNKKAEAVKGRKKK